MHLLAPDPPFRQIPQAVGSSVRPRQPSMKHSRVRGSCSVLTRIDEVVEVSTMLMPLTRCWRRCWCSWRRWRCCRRRPNVGDAADVENGKQLRCCSWCCSGSSTLSFEGAADAAEDRRRGGLRGFRRLEKNFVFETGVTNLWLLAKGHMTPNSDMNRVTQFCTTATEIKSFQVFSFNYTPWAGSETRVSSPWVPFGVLMMMRAYSLTH